MIRTFDTHILRPSTELGGFWRVLRTDGAPVGRILIPGCAESLPGYENFQGVLLYERDVQLSEAQNVLLTFHGVSFRAEVYWDGEKLRSITMRTRRLLPLCRVRQRGVTRCASAWTTASTRIPHFTSRTTISPTTGSTVLSRWILSARIFSSGCTSRRSGRRRGGRCARRGVSAADVILRCVRKSRLQKKRAVQK